MGFRKKKKQEKKLEKTQAQKKSRDVEKVEKGKNVLYPPKEESAVKEVAVAIVCAMVALAIVIVIFNKKSLMNHPYNSINHSYANNVEQQVQQNPDNINEQQENDSSNSDEQVLAGEVKIVEESAFVEPGELTQSTAENGNLGSDSTEERDYILEGSDSRYISTSELSNLSKQELSYARNEIYARHGRLFKDSHLQEYFNSKAWYTGRIAPEAFTDSMLNQYEKANTETIVAVEKAKGYR